MRYSTTETTPGNSTLQLRINEDLKVKLEKHGEFLEATTAYVVSEALKPVFNKDAEFKEWLGTQARRAGKKPSPWKSRC